MHELSLTESIVAICTDNAGGRKVVSVTLEIGDLAGVVPDAIDFCFAAVTRETLLDGARLVIERIAGEGRCGCGELFPLAATFDPCPACGGYGVTIVRGEELRVKELEVE